MAASKRARNSGKQQPGDSPGVPEQGGKPPARKSVARRRAKPREVPQADGPAEATVPGVLPHPPGNGIPTTRNHPTRDPEVWNAAIARATEEGYWRLAAWNHRIQAWTIPSQNDPTIKYVLKRNRGLSGKPAYKWEHFTCTCPAGERGLLVCKHKAAMWLMREHMEDVLREAYSK